MTCMIKGVIIFLYFLLVVTKLIDLLFRSGSGEKRNLIENKVRNNKIFSKDNSIQNFNIVFLYKYQKYSSFNRLRTLLYYYFNYRVFNY